MEDMEKLRQIFLDTDPLCDCDQCFRNWAEVWGERILAAEEQDLLLSTEDWELVPGQRSGAMVPES